MQTVEVAPPSRPNITGRLLAAAVSCSKSQISPFLCPFIANQRQNYRTTQQRNERNLIVLVFCVRGYVSIDKEKQVDVQLPTSL
uniref:Uncharacterized protein MANES_02G090600 n=1 Tax=Rhizophora mucronata TaxID=61149 RepID=A0A2P2JZ24_RHIMU